MTRRFPVIDGGTSALRTEQLSGLRRRECPKCGGNAYRIEYIGEAVDSKGKVVIRPQRIKLCSRCPTWEEMR